MGKLQDQMQMLMELKGQSEDAEDVSVLRASLRGVFRSISFAVRDR